MMFKAIVIFFLILLSGLIVNQIRIKRNITERSEKNKIADKSIIFTHFLFLFNIVITTPESEIRKYRVIKLDNGLEAILISDPISVNSGASLSVRAGANNDPLDFPGLAHFCEHMLFLVII